MNRHSILVFSITALLCSCSRESKPPDRPSSSQPTDASTARQPTSKPSADPEGENPALADYLSFPGCGVKIRQPKGFEKAESFDGFAQLDTQSSIMAARMPGPYKECSAGFTEEHMKRRGLTLLGRQDVKIDGLPGILVHFEQLAVGIVFLKWTLAFGDDRKTIFVTAAFPKRHQGQLSAALKSAVLSTRVDRAVPLDPREDLPFTITASPKLKFTPGFSKALGYTKDGVTPTKSPKDPLFIVAPSLGKGFVGDKREFVEDQLQETATAKRLTVKSTRAITVGGLAGYESLAEAEDEESGTPLIVYQVMLFDGDSYILMRGLVGTELRKEYLPEFKAMARSFKRKRR